MRRSRSLPFLILALSAGAALAGPPDDPNAKPNANPCGDEVKASLEKLRKSSWFHMDSTLITENGPSKMAIDYILPDKMHQIVTVIQTNETTEVIRIGDKGWSNEGKGWEELPKDIVDQIADQMTEAVVKQQPEVGKYSCKGRMKAEGKDVLGYKLEDEPVKGQESTKNEAFRMFYVDAMTGLPVGNMLLSPGREDKPFFKTTYSFPLDMKVEAPKDVAAPKSDAPAPAEAPKP
jgi:hypothetical protein